VRQVWLLGTTVVRKLINGVIQLMNKQKKQEMGQGLIDFMFDSLSLDEIAETFEKKVDTKLYSYEEDKENLVKDWKIKFLNWIYGLDGHIKKYGVGT
jgi:hypothetical protein